MAPSKKQTNRAKPFETQPDGPIPDEKARTVRTSIVLPQTLDENLGVFVLRNDTSKSEVIAKLLTEFLTKEGYQPLKRPKLEVKY